MPGGPYKVVAHVLWGRNWVGARISWTDDGTNWAPVQAVPGPFSATAGDFTLGVTTDGTLCVAWFDRESTDIKVQ